MGRIWFYEEDLKSSSSLQNLSYHCVEDYHPFKKENKWIGFDKHHKIIYGIHVPDIVYHKVDQVKIEKLITELPITGTWNKPVYLHRIFQNIILKKMNLITKRIEPIKMLVFVHVKTQDYSHFDFSININQDGTEIGMLAYEYHEDYSTVENILFYSLYIESGVVQSFSLEFDDPIFVELTESKFTFEKFQLINSDQFGWIISLTSHKPKLFLIETEIRQQYFQKYYRVIFNKTRKTFHLDFITKWTYLGDEKSSFSCNDICFGNKLINITPYGLNIYDFENSQTETKGGVTNPLFSYGHLSAFGFNLQNIFLALHNYGILKFNSNTGKWEDYLIEKSNLKRVNSLSGVSTKNVTAIIQIGKSYATESENAKNSFLRNYKVSYEIHLNKFSVTSLKDSCFSTIWKYFGRFFETLKDKEIAETLHLPHTMIRQYFGPIWSLDMMIDWNYKMDVTENVYGGPSVKKVTPTQKLISRKAHLKI